MPSSSTPPLATASCAGRKCATCACISTARSKRACSRSTASCSAASTKAPGRRRRAAIPGSRRPMRRQLGLDPPERRIGLAAHDFAQALGAPEVILTRAAKLGRRADRDLALRAAHRRARRRDALEGRARSAASSYLALARALDQPRRCNAGDAAGAEAAARGAADAGFPSPRSRTGCAIPIRSTPVTFCGCRRSIRSIRRPARATAARVIHGAIGDYTETVRRGAARRSAERIARARRKTFRAARRLSGSARVLVAALRAHRALVRAMGLRAARRASQTLHRRNPRRIEIPGRRPRIHASGHRRPHRTAAATAATPSSTTRPAQARTEKQVRTGLAPQLTLEAAILRARRLQAICRPARWPKSPMSRCSGGEPAGKPCPINFKDGTPDTQAEHALARLKALAANSRTRRRPIYSLVHPMWKTHYGDYDHLARVKEWSLVRRAASDGGQRVDDCYFDGRRADEVPTSQLAIDRLAARGGRVAECDVPLAHPEAADPDVSGSSRPMPAPARRTCWRSASSICCCAACDPAKILCITFTKAAAANMANRVFGTLAEWTDARRRRARRAHPALHRQASPARRERARARRLFASALETPGGLKVQTIHAFCTRLLHQFPFEANVAARFTVLDEATTTQLLDRSDARVLLEAVGRAGQRARPRAGHRHRRRRRPDLPQGRIGDAIRKRDAIAAWIDAPAASTRQSQSSRDTLRHRAGRHARIASRTSSSRTR